MTPDMAVVTPLNNPGGPEGDTVTVDEQLLNTEYWHPGILCFHLLVNLWTRLPKWWQLVYSSFLLPDAVKLKHASPPPALCVHQVTLGSCTG